MPVPAGTWLLTGKMVLVDGNGPSHLCELDAPEDDDLGSTLHAWAGTTLAFEAIVTRDAPFEARMICLISSVGEPLLVRHARLTATRVFPVNP
jgi:hypothetical protein